MVVDIDRTLHALADPTRRDIVALTARGEHSVSAIARRYPMSFAAVQKHVAVLERAALVRKRRHGREHLVSADRRALTATRSALDQLEALWSGRLDRMHEVVGEATGPRTTTNSKGGRK